MILIASLAQGAAIAMVAGEFDGKIGMPQSINQCKANNHSNNSILHHKASILKQSGE